MLTIKSLVSSIFLATKKYGKIFTANSMKPSLTCLLVKKPVDSLGSLTDALTPNYTYLFYKKLLIF